MEGHRYYKHKIKRGFIGFFIFLAIFGLGAIVMLLWNAILPDVLHVSRITYWQALGILILCKILFGGFGSGPRGGKRTPFGNSEFRQKFMNMSPEERQAFRDKWKQRCGK